LSEVTRILSAIEQGDPHASAQLLPLVYNELRKLAAVHMAREAPDNTLNATIDGILPTRETQPRLAESRRRTGRTARQSY
jgi:hypothetical protein